MPQQIGEYELPCRNKESVYLHLQLLCTVNMYNSVMCILQQSTFHILSKSWWNESYKITRPPECFFSFLRFFFLVCVSRVWLIHSSVLQLLGVWRLGWFYLYFKCKHGGLKIKKQGVSATTIRDCSLVDWTNMCLFQDHYGWAEAQGSRDQLVGFTSEVPTKCRNFPPWCFFAALEIWQCLSLG